MGIKKKGWGALTDGSNQMAKKKGGAKSEVAVGGKKVGEIGKKEKTQISPGCI